MEVKKICILMSTYNGEKYIKDQLDSILSQTYQNIKIIIRDDGSNDNTLNIIEGYKDIRISVYTGENMKPALSFWDLVMNAGEADYYAFADQDDVWDKDKIKEAIKILDNNSKKPTLYFCRKRIVDSHLQPIAGEIDMFDKHPDIGLSLIRCVVAGCTMVFNEQLRNHLIKYSPKKMVMHDIWVLLVADCIGEVIADDRVFMSYRQHTNNYFGAHTDKRRYWKERLLEIFASRTEHSRTIMARELYENYKDLIEPEKRQLLMQFSHLRENSKYRFSLIFDKRIRNLGHINTFLIKVKILLGWI